MPVGPALKAGHAQGMRLSFRMASAIPEASLILGQLSALQCPTKGSSTCLAPEHGKSTHVIQHFLGQQRPLLCRQRPGFSQNLYSGILCNACDPLGT